MIQDCSAAAPPKNMDFISPNSPAYYLTSVAKDRLPVFRLDTLKSIACAALSEARNSGGFLVLAYVIMPDHFHVVTDGKKKAPVIQRFINGITSRRVIDFLKQDGHPASLEKLRHEEYRRGHRYSLWDHHPNVRLLTSEACSCNECNTRIRTPCGLGWWSGLRTIGSQALASGIGGSWKMSRCWLMLIGFGGGNEDGGAAAREESSGS